MLFNSFPFAIFLPIAFTLFWLMERRARQAGNTVLLVGSYLFYGWWDWRFLGLIVASSIVDYLVGVGMAATPNASRRRLLLSVSLALNLGALGIFKYFDFFVASAAEAFGRLGLEFHPATLGVLLPVGISFYTFQTLSYSIDVYRGRMQATRDPLAFFTFVAFFPQLVAGPIERASHLLPQFESKRTFDRDAAGDGMRRILWGLFKKTVVADNLAPMADRVFSDPTGQPPEAVVLGVICFAVQIYCDFSGYSDIAIGTARLFGVRLMDNFRYPYFSRGIGEFWRRWHISLSTWFRDYVYIPLGGSRGSRMMNIRNILATFTISGLWHGAGWPYIVWGAFHGALYVPRMLLGARGARHEGVAAAGSLFPGLREAFQIAGTFAVVCVGWVFFRADSIEDAISLMGACATLHWGVPAGVKLALAYILPVLVLEWIHRDRAHGLDIAHLPRAARHTLYNVVAIAIFLFANTGHVPFIYFQF